VSDPAGAPAPSAPPRGLVGVGIGGLALEAIVLLLAAPAIATAERGHVSAWHVALPLVLAALTVAAAVVLRRPRGRLAGSVLQPLVIAAGVVTWPLYVVGALFGAIWVYYLRLWRT
jgi:hypothetical protein